jgi:hypothetical protein
MVSRQLKLGLSTVGLAVAVAILPAAVSGASSHHKTHHTSKKKSHTTTTTKKAASGVAACPSPSILSTPAGVTYASPTTEQAGEPGWIVCDYTSQGEISLTVSLYDQGESLRTISSTAAATPVKVSGIGNAASHFGTIVYVQRNSARSFSVIDDSGNLTLSQTEAIAKAIAAS